MLDVNVCHSRYVVVGVGWWLVGKVLSEKIKLKMFFNKQVTKHYDEHA